MFELLFGWISPDLVNALFETIGALFIILSVLRLSQDKMVRGISILHVTFFWLWGVWNVFYYPYLDQTLSFVGAILVLAANSLWTGMLIYYTKYPGEE
jgi:uncharacterized membrane protein YfcA